MPYVKAKTSKGDNEYYGGTLQEVKTRLQYMLGNLVSVSEIFNDNEIAFFAEKADAEIDSKLSALYYTPLKKVNGTYPEVIQNLALKIIARGMLERLYSTRTPNATQEVERYRVEIFDEFNRILSRQYILGGQDIKSYSIYSHPRKEPLTPPSGASGAGAGGAMPPTIPTV